MTEIQQRGDIVLLGDTWMPGGMFSRPLERAMAWIILILDKYGQIAGDDSFIDVNTGVFLESTVNLGAGGRHKCKAILEQLWPEHCNTTSALA